MASETTQNSVRVVLPPENLIGQAVDYGLLGWDGTSWSVMPTWLRPLRVVMPSGDVEEFVVGTDLKNTFVVDTKDDAVRVYGDLVVYGTTTFVESPLSIADNMIAMGSGNTTNNFDLGIYGVLNDGEQKYAGIYYDHSIGSFKCAYSLTEPLPNMTSAVLMDLRVAGLIASTLAGTLQTASQPNITTLGGLTNLNAGLNGVLQCTAGVLSAGTLNTDMITQGVTNLYFSTPLARGAISGTSGVSYVTGSGVISLDSTYSPVFASMILSNLTGARLVASDFSGRLVSTSGLSWIYPTTDQVVVSDNGSGGVTLSLPQSIATSSSPTFTGLTLSGLSTGSLIATDGTSGLVSASIGASLTYGGNVLNTVQAIGTGASPTFAGLTLSGVTGSRIIATGSGGTISAVTVGSSLSYSAGTLDTIQAITTTASPTFAGVTVSGLTASALVASSAGKALSSVSLSANLTYSGGILDTVQAIGTGSSPTFAGMTVSGLTASRIVFTSVANALVSAAVGSSLSYSAGTLDTVQAITTTSSPTFAGLTVTGLASSALVATTALDALTSVTIGASLSYSAGTLDTIQALTTSSSPTFAGIKIPSFTTTRIVTTTTGGAFTVAGIGASISYTGGAINTIQQITVASTPTFAGLTLSGLTASALVATNSSKALSSVSIGASLSYSASTLNTIQAITTTSTPTFAGLILSGSSSGNITISAGATPTPYTFTLPSTGGTSGYVLSTNGSGATSWAYPATGTQVYTRAKTTHTSGQSLTANTWVTREWDAAGSSGNMNGVELTMASNILTFNTAGTYHIRLFCDAFNAGSHLIRLYNVTTSSVVLEGTNVYCGNTSISTSTSIISHRLTVTAGTQYKVEHQGSTGGNTGPNTAGSMTNTNDIYGIWEIWRLS